MKLEQSFEVAAPLERVWRTLVDVEHVAPCLPGAAVTGRNDDGSYNGTFTVKIGPTTASYTGRLEMESVDEASHTATMQAHGTDKRGQGGAKATIYSRLAPADGAGTRVEVVTDYHITGRLARFGRGGMIEDISERLLREFAKRLQSSLAAQQDTVVSQPAMAEALAPASEAPATPPAEAPARASEIPGVADGDGVPAGDGAPPPREHPFFAPAPSGSTGSAGPEAGSAPPEAVSPTSDVPSGRPRSRGRRRAAATARGAGVGRRRAAATAGGAGLARRRRGPAVPVGGARFAARRGVRATAAQRAGAGAGEPSIVGAGPEPGAEPPAPPPPPSPGPPPLATPPPAPSAVPPPGAAGRPPLEHPPQPSEPMQGLSLVGGVDMGSGQAQPGARRRRGRRGRGAAHGAAPAQAARLGLIASSTTWGRSARPRSARLDPYNLSLLASEGRRDRLCMSQVDNSSRSGVKARRDGLSRS